MTGGNSAYGRAKSDFYPTPPDVTVALVKAIGIIPGTRVWEPACGEGHMVRALENCGCTVVGTDINMGVDFLSAPYQPCDWIITNPPFYIADKFIERCLCFDRPFALLLKSQYWHARKRLPLFQAHPPTTIFSTHLEARLPVQNQRRRIPAYGCYVERVGKRCRRYPAFLHSA